MGKLIRMTIQVTGVVILIALAAFCVFGFLAAAEAPTEAVWSFRLLYGITGLGSLVGAGWLLTWLRG